MEFSIEKSTNLCVRERTLTYGTGGDISIVTVQCGYDTKQLVVYVNDERFERERSAI